VSALNKIQSVQTFQNPALNFLKDFKYDLGTNDLVQYGAEQYVPIPVLDRACPETFRSFDAGQLAFVRYSKLVSGDKLPFVRSDSSERVVMSANNWTAG
jgi:hypothetical protein